MHAVSDVRLPPQEMQSDGFAGRLLSSSGIPEASKSEFDETIRFVTAKQGGSWTLFDNSGTIPSRSRGDTHISFARATDEYRADGYPGGSKQPLPPTARIEEVTILAIVETIIVQT